MGRGPQRDRPETKRPFAEIDQFDGSRIRQCQAPRGRTTKGRKMMRLAILAAIPDRFLIDVGLFAIVSACAAVVALILLFIMSRWKP